MKRSDKISAYLIPVALICVSLSSFFLFKTPTAFAATNLIYNPGFETAASSTPPLPDGWVRGKWGTNTTTFSYPIVGNDGSKAVQVSISSLSSGDAKWSGTPSTVTPGKTYEYSDFYKSNVITHVTLQYTMNDGSLLYPDIGDPPISGSWKSESFRFTVPPNVKNVVVFHLINQVGTLAIDNVSLTDVSPIPPPPPDENNLIVNPSLEYIDGSGGPASWLKGKWGNNNTVFSFPTVGYDGANAARVEMTSYTSGDAKWYWNNVNVNAGGFYQFSDYSKSNLKTFIAAQFKKSDGTFLYRDLGSVGPSSTWTPFSVSFTVPPGVVSMTVFHVVKGVGWLEVDNFKLAHLASDPTKFDKGYVSINFDDGWLSAYDNALPILDDAGFVSDEFIITGRIDGSDPNFITVDQVQDLQARGEIVGGHTRTHRDLTTLSAADAQAEIAGSRQDLIQIGISPVNFFAYPFGAYNDQVKQIVKNSGFLAARSSDGGYNDKTVDLYALRRQPMVNTTTFNDVKNYVDTAMANKTWVILLFHEVNDSGNQYAVTPALFSQIVDYLITKNITPITIGQGVSLMKQ